MRHLGQSTLFLQQIGGDDAGVVGIGPGIVGRHIVPLHPGLVAAQNGGDGLPAGKGFPVAHAESIGIILHQGLVADGRGPVPDIALRPLEASLVRLSPDRILIGSIQDWEQVGPPGRPIKRGPLGSTVNIRLEVSPRVIVVHPHRQSPHKDRFRPAAPGHGFGAIHSRSRVLQPSIQAGPLPIAQGDDIGQQGTELIVLDRLLVVLLQFLWHQAQVNGSLNFNFCLRR